jgi:hypothetical protein
VCVMGVCVVCVVFVCVCVCVCVSVRAYVQCEVDSMSPHDTSPVVLCRHVDLQVY